MPDVVARIPAKMNIVLAVGARRADGFHELATVFHAVSLWDQVTVTPAPDVGISVTGPHSAGVPVDESNLAVRAARLLAKRCEISAGVALRVHKGIPVAGGLAGGSADAAGALLACSKLWGLGLSPGDLQGLAAELGSDVPFALRGGTALGLGRGERLSGLSVAGQLHWVVAASQGGLSTADVYQRFDARTAPGLSVTPTVEQEALGAIQSGDPAAVASVLRNDLQPAAVDLHPRLRNILEAGEVAGALGGIVSGSGPTCVFLARDAAHATAIASELERSGTCESAVSAVGPVSPNVI